VRTRKQIKESLDLKKTQQQQQEEMKQGMTSRRRDMKSQSKAPNLRQITNPPIYDEPASISRSA